MWVEKIKKYSSDCEFLPPANSQEIFLAEENLKTKLHPDLKSALMESNGVFGVYGLGLLWNIERIKMDNLSFRENQDFKELYMPFDHLMFFADAGNGDQFAYAIQGGQIIKDDIFVWNHENDSRNWVAPNLAYYLEWWLNGKMTI